ncbi:MAG: DUF2723 domain-containing protein [Saprospiraceae bacterium]
MNSYKNLTTAAGWLVFLLAFIVLAISAEPTGSLWDCGEFVAGAYKLQVVHPPGAPLFLIVGRLFAWLGTVFSDDPSNIAYSVNLMSSLCTAFAAAFICWITIILGKLSLIGREESPSLGQSVALSGAGIVAGLSAAFCVSIWFSAVEGEVYAMSTFFTALTLWSFMKWYVLPDEPNTDRWLLLAAYSAGLSVGVHLLSLLTFPAMGLLYYFKKYKKHTILGAGLAFLGGAVAIGIVQSLIITGLPKLWAAMEMFTVNTLGLPFHTGLIPMNLLLIAIVFFAIRYAQKNKNAILERIVLGVCLVGIGFSTVAMVVIRSNADTPINMNAPTDAMRLVPYLNREQYGERPLFRGPQFDATPISTDSDERYGRVGNKYEVVDYKYGYEYKPGDEVLLPRMSHTDEGRKALYKMWMDGKEGRPSMADNLTFALRYQVNWMYWRYFMWNFVGRQNGEQGYFPWNPKDGNWLSGIKAIDSNRLYNQDKITPSMAEDMGRNTYYFIPLILGLLGMVYHYRKNRKDFAGLLALFLLTGLGIIFYTNEPPNEPRERDYVLAGSFFTFCIWIGFGVMAIFNLLTQRIKLGSIPAGALATVLALSAPLLMATQNFDDIGRKDHYGARDYAMNFLNSCEPNALIFTYGDNDTYPLWYCQEVENVRPDVRVINLSLIAVDWYIDQMRRKVNESAAVKISIPSAQLRGFKRNQVFYYNPDGEDREMTLTDALKFIAEDHPLQGSNRNIETYLPSKKIYMPIDLARAKKAGMVTDKDSGAVSRIEIPIGADYLTKDDIAILDIINSNIYDRPIYFAVTCREDKLLGLGDYLQLEGFGLRVVPFKSQSDRTFAIYGSGRVDPDKVFKNVMEKFKWGNFDKKRLFVDHSFAPSINAHKMIMLRTAISMITKGDKERAVKLAEKYFTVFPSFNFPPDNTTLPFFGVMAQGGAFDKAKPYMKEMATYLVERGEFHQSLDMDQQSGAFADDMRDDTRAMNELQRIANDQKDDAFAKELETMFKPFNKGEVMQLPGSNSEMPRNN